MDYLKGLAAAALISITFSVIPASGSIALPETVAARGHVNGGTAGEAGGGTRAVRPEGFGEGYIAGSESAKRLIDDVNVFVGTDGFGKV